jgi:hypothetical protein
VGGRQPVDDAVGRQEAAGQRGVRRGHAGDRRRGGQEREVERRRRRRHDDPQPTDQAFAHSSDASDADWFRALVQAEDGTRTVVFERLGQPANRNGSWRTASVSLDDWAGQTIRIVFSAKDGANGKRPGPQLARGSTTPAGSP